MHDPYNHTPFDTIVALQASLNRHKALIAYISDQTNTLRKLAFQRTPPTTTNNSYSTTHLFLTDTTTYPL